MPPFFTALFLRVCGAKSSRQKYQFNYGMADENLPAGFFLNSMDKRVRISDDARVH